MQQTARRVLDTTCGPHMNTWFVARHPIGHFVQEKRTPAPEQTGSLSPPNEDSPNMPILSGEGGVQGEKTFFLKARIFAGQADVNYKLGKKPTNPYDDFKWLTKQEIEPIVHSKYWSAVKDMLVEQ
jgi:large subunit ribosomal protein L46